VSRALRYSVWGEREHEPTRDGRLSGQPEGAKPGAPEPPGEHVAEKREGVPRPDRPEQLLERPVREAEDDALEVEERLGLRLEGVGVPPRRTPALELMPRQPEVVRRLKVVAWRRLAVTGTAARKEALVGFPERRPSCRRTGGDVEKAG
jgi:hypothetical protein